MKLSVHLPEQIVTACTLLPSFCENGIKLENCQYISAGNNVINLNQPINLPWKPHFELVNRNMNTTFSICKKTRNWFYHITKRGDRTIKSQIYKNMNIIFEETIYKKLFTILLFKINSSNTISLFSFLLPLNFLVFNLTT